VIKPRNQLSGTFSAGPHTTKAGGHKTRDELSNREQTHTRVRKKYRSTRSTIPKNPSKNTEQKKSKHDLTTSKTSSLPLKKNRQPTEQSEKRTPTQFSKNIVTLTRNIIAPSIPPPSLTWNANIFNSSSA
jgi:hypothetical protein